MLTLFSCGNVGKHCSPTGNTDESFKCGAHTHSRFESSAHQAMEVIHKVEDQCQPTL